MKDSSIMFSDVRGVRMDEMRDSGFIERVVRELLREGVVETLDREGERYYTIKEFRVEVLGPGGMSRWMDWSDGLRKGRHYRSLRELIEDVCKRGDNQAMEEDKWKDMDFDISDNELRVKMYGGRWVYHLRFMKHEDVDAFEIGKVLRSVDRAPAWRK